MKTRVCIPVTATNVEQAIIDLKQAEEKADVIELRIDYICDITEKKLVKLLENKIN